MQSTRALWSAVVLHAVNDIDSEHYRSLEYGEAVAFFTAAHGPWAESRQAIADYLGLHSDDLTRLGRAAIEARHLRDGPEPITVRPAVEIQPTSTRPVPRVTNPAPVVPRPPVIRRPDPPERDRNRTPNRRPGDPPRDRDWWIRRFMDKQVA
jgi:hypothetical protein